MSNSEFMQDLDDLARSKRRKMSNVLLLAIVAFFVAAVVWACLATLDEVARGNGKVIPSSQVKVVQNLEGGILTEILVKTGAKVTKGQVLVKLDRTSSGSMFLEKKSEYLDLLASIARLEAEISGDEKIDFPEELEKKHPELMQPQTAFLQARRGEAESSISILRSKYTQRREELAEQRSSLVSQRRNHVLAKEELSITEPMVAKGVTSRIELIRLQREITELVGSIEQTKHVIPKLVAAVTEMKHTIQEERDRYQSRALEELNKSKARLAALEEILPAFEDRVERTDIRSPVDGVVKSVHVNTIGGVVSPGEPIVEVVPQKDSLLVEAKFLPQDIAFIHPGQNATVKITAYDFTIYGGLDGKVENISADSMVDEEGMTHYLIKVRTDKDHLGGEDRPLPIIAGMVAEVDVLTGKKTVFDYLMKPILKAKQQALRER
jgi:membrane fusion protein, adhesin transport system